MPFAPAIPPVWPPEAWDGHTLHVPTGAMWCALKVKPRCEKQVAGELTRHASAYFLGMHSTTRVYQRRRIETQLPLFPGYVFAAVEEEQRNELWKLRNVVTALVPPSHEKLARELSHLCHLILSGAPLTPEEQLQPGEPARIISGSLMGLEGRVLKNCDGMRLIVGVTWLGQGVSVSVTPDMVERISASHGTPAAAMPNTNVPVPSASVVFSPIYKP